jgi:transcriptional regulator with XRE-family HTH domain
MFIIISLVIRRNIVGARVRKARKAAKPPVTQLELVARLQVLGIKMDQGRLSKIETGRRPVSDVEIAAIAGALKVPVSSLFE